MPVDAVSIDFQVAGELVDVQTVNLELAMSTLGESAIRSVRPRHPEVVFLLDDLESWRAVLEHGLEFFEGDQAVRRQGRVQAAAGRAKSFRLSTGGNSLRSIS